MGGDYLHISEDADDDGSFVHVCESVYPSHQGHAMTSSELSVDSTVATGMSNFPDCFISKNLLDSNSNCYRRFAYQDLHESMVVQGLRAGCCKQVYQPNFLNFNDRSHIFRERDSQLQVKVEEGKLGEEKLKLPNEISKMDFDYCQFDEKATISFSTMHLQKLLAARSMLYDLDKVLDDIYQVTKLGLRDTSEMQMILGANRNEASRSCDEPLRGQLLKSASAEVPRTESFLPERGADQTVSNTTHAGSISNEMGITKDLVNVADLSATTQSANSSINKARCTKSTFPTSAIKSKNVADLFFHF